MASFYSKPADYGTYTQAINFDLVNFVMQSKQQKYDYNLEKIQDKVKNQLGSLDLERAQDREYFLDKAQSVLASVGDMAKIDWSKNGVTRNVDAQLNSIIDDRVLNDVISTKNYRTFQNQLREKQNKNDGTYSEVNAAYAMDKYGVNDWLRGDSDSVGSIQYQDYVDVGSELNEISENLDKYARVYKRQLPSGDGKYWVTEEGKQLTAQEVKAIAQSQLSDKAKSQMQINGWANYNGGVRPTEEIIGDFQEFKNNKLKSLNSTITTLNAKIKNLEGTNSPLLEKYIEQRNAYIDTQNQIENKFDSWIQNGAVDSMTTTMESERVLDAFGRTFSIDNMESTLTENPYVLAEFKENLKRETQAQKITLEAAEKLKKSGGDVEGSQYQTITPSYTRDGEQYTAVNKYDETVKDVASSDQNYKSTVNQVFASIKDMDIRNALMTDYDPDSGVSKEAYLEFRMQQMAAEGSKFITPAHLKAMEEARLRRDYAIDIKTQAEDYALKVLETGGSAGNSLDNVVEEYADNKNILLLDSDGKAVNAKTLFERYNIKDGEDLNNNKEVKDLVLRSYYADRIINTLDSGVGPDFWGLVGAGAVPVGVNTYAMVRAGKKMQEQQKEVELYKRRLTQLFGGDENQAQQFLEEAAAKGIGKEKIKWGVTFNSDDSVREDNSLDAWLSPESVAREAGRYLANKNLSTRTDAVIIKGNTEMSEDLTNHIRANKALISGNIQGQVSKGKSYTLESLGDGTIEVQFNVERDGKTEVQTARIPIANMPESILNEINFYESKPLFTRENMKEVTAKASLVEDVDLHKVKGVAGALGTSMVEVVDLVTKQGLEATIQRAYGTIVGSDAAPTPIGSALKKMINSDDLVVKIVESNGDYYNQIAYVNPTTGAERVLFTSEQEIPEEHYDRAYFNTKYAPQLQIYETTIKSLDLTKMAGQENPAPFIKKIMEIYGG